MPDTKELHQLIGTFLQELKRLVLDLAEEQALSRKQWSEVYPKIDQRVALLESEMKHQQTDCSKCEQKVEARFRAIDERIDKRENTCSARADKYIALEKNFDQRTDALDKKLIKIISWAAGFGAAMGFFLRILWEHMKSGG